MIQRIFAAAIVILSAEAVDVADLPAGERPCWGQEPVVAVSAARDEVVLNGLWRFAPNIGERPAPPTGGWGWMRVPGSWRVGGWPNVFGGLVAAGQSPAWKGFDKGESVNAGWYERPLRIPAAWAGRRVVLDLERVSTDATVQLDGQTVGTVGWPGGRVELTPAVKPGAEQQLRILVLASAGAGEFAQFMGTATEQVSRSKAECRARGLIGDVVLTALPTGPEISEVFAKPTVEGGIRLDLEVTVTGATVAADAVLEAVITTDDGAEVGTFTAPVQVSATASQVLRAGWPVPGAKAWDVGQPNLHQVEVGLRGATGDRQRVRFGFRQVRVDGRRVLLNGSELRLRPNLASIQTNGALLFADETRWHIAERRAQGYNLTELWPGGVQRRGTEDYQAVPARIADEEGWLITGMLPHLGDFVKGDGIDEAGLAAALRPYRRLRNHPSILFWGSSGNYFGHKTDQDPRNLGRRGFADADPDYRKRAAAGNKGLAVYRAMDPTRPQFTHHGGDVGDLHTCNNYLNLLPLQEREEWLSQWSQSGDMPFWPVEFETPVNLSLQRNRNGHVGSDTSEPFLSEYCAGVIGERAFASEPAEYRAQMAAGYEGKDTWRFRSVRMGSAPAFQELQVINQRALWRSWRALGATILPLPWEDAYTHRTTARAEVDAAPFVPGQRGPWQARLRRDAREALPAAAALGYDHPAGAGGPTLAYLAHVPGADPADLVAKDHHVVAGQPVRKTALLINDARAPQPWTARWRALAAGAVVAQGEAAGDLAVAARALVPIAFTAPAGGRAEVVIELEAAVGGHPHRDRLPIQVYPVQAPASGTLLVADPEGDTTRALAALGFATQAWDGRPAPGQVVVVGRRALARPALRSLDLAGHVAAGGRALVMAQERAWYERDQGLRTAQWSSRTVFAVPTMQDHPVLAGLAPADLCDWNGAGSGVPPRPAPVYEKDSHNYPRYGWKWGNSGSVCGLALEKPHHGGWRPLLQCEFDLAFSPLLELPVGKGLLLWCTLDLEGRSRPDPAAELILRRLVDHARTWAGEAERRPAALLGDCARVAGLGLAGGAATALPADHRPVVIGPDAAIDDDTLRAWIAAGGRALVLVGGTGARLGFTAAMAKDHLGSLTPPAWPEARGLAASDLRLRNQATLPVLGTAPADGAIAADGLLGRLALGQGVAILTTIDPRLLPADAKPWFRFSQWRWTRALAQLAGNLGIQARGDGKSLLVDLGRDAPRPLAGTWRMQVERALAPGDKPWEDTPSFDPAPAQGDTTAWLPIPVPGAWERSVAQFDGATWVRTRVAIPAAWAGQKLVLELGPVDDFDTVWWNGERIGGMGKENPDAWQTARSYSVKPELVQAGEALIAIRVFDWFGGGGFGADKPEAMRLRRADGQGSPIPLAGAWRARVECAVPPAKAAGEVQDTGIDATAASWHLPATRDDDWQPVRLPRLFEEALADIDGAVWLRTAVEVPAHWAGRPLELNLGRIADADVVYVSGVEVGRGAGTGNRTYAIPAALVKAGRLELAVRVFNRQGPGGLLGVADDLSLGLPGDIAGAPWYERGYRTDFSTGDDPFRYYRW